MDPDKTPQKNPDVEEEIVDGEFLLYQPETGKVHNLNPTASFVWNLCDGKHPVGDMAEAVDENCDSENPEKIEEDLCQLIKDMKKEDLLL